MGIYLHAKICDSLTLTGRDHTKSTHWKMLLWLNDMAKEEIISHSGHTLIITLTAVIILPTVHITDEYVSSVSIITLPGRQLIDRALVHHDTYPELKL